MNIVISERLLINQLNRDAPSIAETFDAACKKDLEDISALLAQACVLVMRGAHFPHRANKDLQQWSCAVLTNVANSLSAAVYVLRGGYVLVPGTVLRTAVEAMAVCLHGLATPADLKLIQDGKFNTPNAITTAKQIIPPFGQMNGLLSNMFTHIGRLHQQIRPLVPFKAGDVPLDLNLKMIKSCVWLYFVVCEFAFIDQCDGVGRYWRHEPPNKAVFDPSEAEREWQKAFLGGIV